MTCKQMQHREISRYGRAKLIERIEKTRAVLEKFLTLLQSAPAELDRFVSHLCRARREYRRICETAGKCGKQIERCVMSSFQIAESTGFKGEFRQWEDLLQLSNNGLLQIIKGEPRRRRHYWRGNLKCSGFDSFCQPHKNCLAYEGATPKGCPKCPLRARAGCRS